MTRHGVYAMSAITALTAQNTTGVRAVQESTPEFLKQQLDAVFEDIFPDAVKNWHGVIHRADSCYRRQLEGISCRKCGRGSRYGGVSRFVLDKK